MKELACRQFSPTSPQEISIVNVQAERLVLGVKALRQPQPRQRLPLQGGPHGSSGGGAAVSATSACVEDNENAEAMATTIAEAKVGEEAKEILPSALAKTKTQKNAAMCLALVESLGSQKYPLRRTESVLCSS